MKCEIKVNPISFYISWSLLFSSGWHKTQQNEIIQNRQNQTNHNEINDEL